MSSIEIVDTYYKLLKDVLKIKSIQDVCDYLYIHTGTIKRWLELKRVPKNYENDLLKLLGKPLSFNEFRDLDQFYTKNEISKYCYSKTVDIIKKHGFDINKYTFIEPSVGNGSFFNLLPSNRKIGVDINPSVKGASIITSDYLDFKPDNANYIVIGNPPFGLRGNLALRFINHSYKFADVVAFILPPLFNSDGKGVPRTRVQGYKLIHTEDLPINSFIYPNGKEVEVSTIFQIWAKVDIIEEQNNLGIKDHIKVYSLSDGGTPSSTRNKNMLYNCDAYLPSTCFTGMRVYNSFNDLPNNRGYGIKFLKNNDALSKLVYHNINWEEVAFLSTNSAINLRTSLIENAIYKEAAKHGINGFV